MAPVVIDSHLPAVQTLLSPEAEAVLSAAVTAAGARIESWRPTLVRYRPRRSITVTYSTELREDAGTTGTAVLVAHAGSDIPDGTVIVENGTTQVGVWRFPHDPLLPGLRHAMDQRLRADLLGQLGIYDPVRRVRTRSYRPTRRAVVEVATDRHRLFLKVVRLSRVAGLQARHARIEEHVRVPRSHGWSADLGLVALEALPGKTLRTAITSGEDAALPAAADLIDLLDALPTSEDRTVGVVERATDHVELLAALVSPQAGRLATMLEAIGEAPDEELAPVHGDFHSGQVIIAGGQARGVIDIDAAGQGRRSDDLATMLGHIFTLAAASGNASRPAAYGADLMRAFQRNVDPAGLRLRTTAAMLGFAALPFRLQRPDWPAEVTKRVVAAEQWTMTGL